MSKYDELKRLAEFSQMERNANKELGGKGIGLPGTVHLSRFNMAATPEAVLELIAENEAMAKRILTIDIVHGQKAQLSWIALAAERDQLKAENEALRLEREGKVLCDLELFETLRDAANTEADDHRQCMATYRPLRQENLDSVVKKCDDLLAAMGKGEQS